MACRGDFHCHSTASDGILSPSDLIKLAYEQGVRGNTHMMMMDVNNLQVADWILSWVEKNIGKKPLAISKR